ncbi:MFS transporter [Egibacter rhizosphaerae]|nr:MFS transporter [Egibacter rhizosphaerae]
MTSRTPSERTPGTGSGRFTRPGWLAPPIVAAGLLALFAGSAQFGFTAIAADVANEFGEPMPDAPDDPMAQIGLTLTTLGVGFAIVRLASLGSLPASSLADRFGRRRTLLATTAVGLLATALAAGSPAFWVLVALLAISRPLLTATDVVAMVIAAEETRSRDRSAAIAFIGGAYAVGSGIISVARGLLDVALPDPGFREVLALVLIPLVLVPFVARRVSEPPRFQRAAESQRLHQRLGRMPAGYRGRLAILCAITAGVGLVIGPAWTYLFVYGEGMLGASPIGMSGLVLAAGPVGLVGLVVGRFVADRLGRRAAAASTMALAAVMAVVAYSDGFLAFAVGYLTSIVAMSAYTPAGGALDTEVFPTSVRSTAGGWLAASGVVGSVLGLFGFGVLVDVTGSFAPAALLVCGPAAVLALLYGLLPETRGRELEETAPEPS